MKNLYRDAKQFLEEKAPKGTKKPLKGQPAKYKDPVHLPGIGVVERSQAEKHFPGMKYNETNLHKEEIEISEAKWVTDPPQPAKDLKRGDGVWIRHPDQQKGQDHKLMGGTFLRTRQGEKDRNGHHLIKTSDGELRVVHPDHVFKELGDAWKNPRKISEANEGVDHIAMTVPLFIRCLEWAHEDAKDDVELHKFVERVIAKGGVLDTADYESFLGEEVVAEMTDKEVIKAGAHMIKDKKGKDLVDTMKRISRDIERSRTKAKDRTGPIIK